MAVENPLSIAVISRLPDREVMTAGFLVMMAVAIWIESPVIDLLATATTLGTTRQRYETLTRFVKGVMAWVTLAHGLVAFTPLYDALVRGLLRIPPEVAEAVRPGLMLMLPWSALIGWRRYLQGILIRHGRTKVIGTGTSLRVGTLVVSLLTYATLLPWSSLTIIALALLSSVTVETIFVHWASRGVVRDAFPDRPDEHPLSMGDLLRFHLPLTVTTMVMLLLAPIVSAALARGSEPVLQLAGWQVAFALIFLLRTITFALPEPVISLYRDRASAETLRSFCLRVGIGASALLFLLAVSGLDRVLFVHLLGASEATAQVAHLACLASAASPLLNALQSYARGILTAEHRNQVRLAAAALGTFVLVALLELFVAAEMSSTLTAGLALTVSMAAELGVLWVAAQRAIRARTVAVG